MTRLTRLFESNEGGAGSVACSTPNLFSKSEAGISDTACPF